MIKRGDEFCVASEGFQGKIIRFITKIQSHDGEAKYNHSGIILSQYGETFEALWSAKKASLNKYKGRPIVIYRPVETVSKEPVTKLDIESAIKQTLDAHEGDPYPLHRLAMYLLISPFLKYLTTKNTYLMCSEVVAKYETYLNVYDGEYGGVTPDDLHDRWEIARTHELVYEGIWGI